MATLDLTKIVEPVLDLTFSNGDKLAPRLFDLVDRMQRTPFVGDEADTEFFTKHRDYIRKILDMNEATPLTIGEAEEIDTLIRVEAKKATARKNG